ncbi:MAG: hypothetical protein IPQ07_04675 [Myxococcales bacterium]|nr:hypothetical protein [Myxococcales bacterium]
MKKLLSRIGTVVVGLVMLGGGALVAWNVFGMGPYGDTCSYSIGCKSFYCLQHELRGADQVVSAGHCTKSCDSDGDCGTGAACVKLGDDARDDLPPFGKPDKACMVLRLTPAPTR